jgi:EmrB/QacA subfamily drug resistance transporter
MLLGGRLGDLFGHRRLFLTGLSLFTVASLVCGLAQSQHFLITARAVQGVGGAVVSAVALSLIMTIFTDPVERTKAMGVFGFVMAGGGSIGVLAGGILTNQLDWHWVFLVNLPIGIAVFALILLLIPGGTGRGSRRHLDLGGALTLTSSLILAVYALENKEYWLLAPGGALFGIFLLLETRVREPLVPLRLFRVHNVSTANIIGVLWSIAMFSLFFLSALYLQLVLGYSPLQVGLAFLPANLIMGAFSLGLSAKIVMRFGLKQPITVGMGLIALGLLLFARAPVDGTFVTDVLPAMIIVGFGVGIAFNPVLIAAMSDVDQSETGLASGVANTAFMMGGALGLALLSTLAASRTESLRAAGEDSLTALTGGYHAAFLAGALFAAAAGVVAAAVLRPAPMAAPTEAEPVAAEAA